MEESLQCGKSSIVHTFPQVEDFMEESLQVTASSFRERDTLISQAANLVVRGMESHLVMLAILGIFFVSDDHLHKSITC